jgi:PKD repeat protein
VAYWRLGESSGSAACDVTGAHGGSYSGSVALGQAGALSGDANTAARFSAGGQASVPQSAALNLNGAFTLEAWVKPAALPASGWPGLMRKGQAQLTGASGGWLLWYARDTRTLNFKRENSDKTVPGWTLGPVGTWTYVAVTYDGAAQNTLRFYLNGSLVGTSTGPPGGYPALSSTDVLQLGRGDDTTGNHTVDEIALYSTALSGAGILQHYQTGAGSAQAPTAPTNFAAAGGDGRVTLTWDAASDTDLAGYRVYRRNTDGTWPAAPLATTNASTLSYADTTAANGTAYTYRVTAYDAAGHESPPSNEASATPTRCSASSPYSSLVAGTPGLVGYWRLGERSGTSACDVTGAHGGTYSGSVTLGQAGAPSGDADTAARFTGSGQAVVPHAAALNLSGAFTVEAWVKPETLAASGYPGLLRKGRSELTGASGGWLLYYKPDTRSLSFKRGGVEQFASGWAVGPPGTWTHIALTYDGTAQNTVRFYVNGAWAGSANGPPGGYATLTSTDALQLGHGDDDAGDHSVDEVALYSTALSGATILDHYEAGVGSGSGQAPAAPTNLSGQGSDGQVDLSWNAPSSPDVASYRVYRRNPDGTWPTSPLAATSRASYHDSPLTNDTAYTYRVTAVSSGGAESAPSGELSVTPTATLPTGFSEVTRVSGLTRPTALSWAPDGRMFVAEKDGDVRVVDANGTLRSAPLLDISDHVNAAADRGLLGIAVDSAFAANHYLYLLYTYDLNPLSPDSLSPMVSRLTRVTVNPDNTLVNPSAPETVILGSNTSGPCGTPSNTDDCIPSEGASHSIGTVRSDPDGTLWIGSGDASSFNVVDALAFRTYDEQSFAGKIVHVDRNGRGLAGHPFCPTDSNLQDVCTKLYAKGFRNPFRFSLRPGAGPIVADVGWNTREEIDQLQPGRNYGWPCYEGTLRTPGYSEDAPCASEYAREGTAGADVPPDYDYDHQGQSSAVVGGPVYQGAAYPAGYSGSAFFGDYARGFVERVLFDAQGRVTGVAGFAPHWSGVDLESAPNGNIAFADLGNFGPGAGSVREFVYTPNNGPPVAHASATPTSGAAPLPVQFTGSGSTDPDNDALTYDWDFGDGSAHSAQADPSHTYTANGTYTARLRVDDGNGHTATDTAGIQVGNNTPPTATIISPADGSTYRDGQTIQLKGSGADTEDGTLPGSSLSWHVVLHHNTHLHDLGTFTGTEPSFAARTDHDADSYYEVTLTATDSEGRTDSKTITLHPETVNVTLASSPSGVGLSYSGTAVTAPATRATAIGYVATVTAPDSYVTGSQTYQFVSWSDGGARVHDITVGTSDFTLTATYRLAAVDGLSQVAGPAIGSSDPTAFAANHRLVVTQGGRLLAVHGRASSGVQLAWRDPAGTWQTTTTGATSTGGLLSGTGTGDWPASIALAPDSAGSEHAWVVWGASAANGNAIQMRRLSGLDSAGGPSVGPVVTVDAPSLGAFRPDIALERTATGTQSAAIVWSRRASKQRYELVTGWFDNLGTDTPPIHDASVLFSANQSASFGGLAPSAAGMKMVARATSGTLRLYRHALSDPLTTWNVSASGGSISASSSPTAVALSSGNVLTAVESDTTNQVVQVKRFPGGAGTPTTDLQLTGYRQPVLASDGVRAWLVMVRGSDGLVVSREMSATGAWSWADRVEVDASGGGNFAWPNVVRDVDSRLRLVVRGPAGGSASSAVLAFQRLS